MLGNAIRVLDCCRKANIQNVAFSTINEKTNQPIETTTETTAQPTEPIPTQPQVQ
jgi:hypothetical protein